jgi:hypothetical protein
MKFTNTFTSLLIMAFIGLGIGYFAVAINIVGWVQDRLGTEAAVMAGFGAVSLPIIILSLISDVIRGDREEDEGGW